MISTASILFYFLYHSQKTEFPVDINAIKQFISKARAELEGVSLPTRLCERPIAPFATLAIVERGSDRADVRRQR